jgi:putative ABC transport system substrate-binding protein
VRLGFVGPASSPTATRGIEQFWGRLRELGYIEGKNLRVEARWAEGRYDRLPALMREVLERDVDVLVTYSTPATIAAKNATSTTPIVGVVIGDPIRSGVVTSLARPGGNLTGFSVGFAEGVAGKWLELLQEAVPRLSTVAVIANPGTAIAHDLGNELKSIAPTRDLKLQFFEVHEAADLDRAFAEASRKAQAALLLPDPMMAAHRARITALAEKHRLPTMYYLLDYVYVGGLMAYAPDLAVQWRRAADYVDKILKGARAGDLPIEQPSQFELVVNLKAAQALRLTIPESILLRAGEVIR